MSMASMLETKNRSSHLTRYHLSTTKVSKVFDIPKLFEEILQFYLQWFNKFLSMRFSSVIRLLSTGTSALSQTTK